MLESHPTAPDDGLTIGGEIGSGAIATVVHIDDRVRGARYAGKILHDRHLRDAAAARRFLREAELASRLAHDNLVRVWGTRTIGGRTVMLMELVEGPNLADRLARQGPVDESELIAMARGIASGLSYAHSAGVIHRDLKPANILLAPPRRSGEIAVPKIADFGMARASSFASADKGALTVLGTPQYMAPECLEPLAVDSRTDLYALGCILFELATGEPPYRGATPMAVLQAHREAPIPELPARFSPPMRALVRRLLGKAPGERLQSGASVVDALARVNAEAAAARVGGGALAQVQRAESTAEGHCAKCGEKVLRELRVCFACGTPQVITEAGDWTVFVTGPGGSPNKIDSGLRDRLVRWVAANAAAGLEVGRLQTEIPRLPFAFVTKVSDRSADTIVTSLVCLGVTAERAQGRLWNRGIQRKTGALSGRAAMVSIAVLGAPMAVHPIFGLATLPLAAVTLPVIYGVTLKRAARAYAVVSEALPSSLPPRISEQLQQLHATVASIVEQRHREALRAVVNRVISLCRCIEVADPNRPELEAELGHAISVAAAATVRMDALDRIMAQPDFDPAEPRHRHTMHERDIWGARLLDLTATLEALSARHASAEARLRNAAPDDLDDLRAMVEALEEVQQG